MATITRIDGMEFALAQFRRAPDVARKHIGNAVRLTEITLAGKVRRAAPRETGALQQSIGSTSRGLVASIVIEAGEIQGRRPDIYWRFVEFGTVHAPAQPFIRPQSETEFQPYQDRVKTAAKNMERDLEE
jgi:HK97 gp10 family phage protein